MEKGRVKLTDCGSEQTPKEFSPDMAFLIFLIKFPALSFQKFKIFIFLSPCVKQNPMEDKFRRWFVCLCLVFVFPHVFADSYTFRSLSVSEGMPDLVVNAIYKDSRGFVWFGTNTTLERFDGARLRHYFLEATNGNDAKEKRVYSIVETPEGEIWAGTGIGLFRVDDDTGKLSRYASDVIDSGVHAFFVSGDTVYVGTEKGLFIHAGDGFSSVQLDGNIFSPANRVTGIAGDSHGILWISTLGGLKSFNPLTGKVGSFPPQPGRAASAYYNVALVGARVFLGTMTDGIVEYDVADGVFRPYIDVGCGVISSLSTDGKDLLYVGTDGNGVHFISVSANQIVRSFRHDTNADPAIRSNSVYSVLADSDGLLWIGFYQLGVDYSLYRSHLFQVYRFGSRFTTEGMLVRTVSFHEKQKLIGTRDGFIFIDEADGRFKTFDTPQLRASIIISSCYFSGKYYIGTYGGGMYMFDPRTLGVEDFYSSEPYPFKNGHIFCIRPDREGCLWVGTSNGLYCFRDGEKVRHFQSADTKLPEGNVYEIFFDSTGKGWICTENGMCIWDPSTSSLKTDVFPEGFINREKVRMVYESSDHRLLFLPEKGNLFVSDLSLKNFRRVGKGTLLDGKSLMSVVEDDSKVFWIATNNGVFRYDGEEGVMPFGMVDGIPSNVFINCYALKDSAGTLWFGNSNGLVSLPGGKERVWPELPYAMSISGVLVDGVDRPELLERKGNTYRISLGSRSSSLTLLLANLLYVSPDEAVYEYREADDEEWKLLIGKSEFNLYNVPKGGCRYYIRRTGYPESAIELEVLPPSSGGWWAGVLALLLAVAGVLYYRRKHVRKQTPVACVEPSATAVSSFDVGESVNVAEEPEPVIAGHPLPEEPVLAADEEEGGGKYKTNKLSDEECERLSNLLDEVMNEKKPYIHTDLKIADLAFMVGSSSHALSYLFNQYLKKSYYDYVNEYRVLEFKTIVTSEDCSKYTLEALAERCGFSSRASFFRSFKKATGITPNEYIKSVQK